VPTDEPTTLRISQDYQGKTIVEMPNGDELPGVARVAVYLDNDTGTVEAHITVRGVALDVLCPTYAKPAPRRVERAIPAREVMDQARTLLQALQTTGPEDGR